MMRRYLCFLLSAVMLAAMLCMTASAFAITPDTVLYTTDTTLADGLTYEKIYAQRDSVSARGYLFTYTPGGTALPVLTYGSYVFGRESTSSMVKTGQALSENEDLRFVGAINGDFFSMQTGIPLGVMIDGGEILTSDAGERAFGIRADGSYVIGDPALQITLQRTAADGVVQTLPVAHINKYPAVWGAYLCTPAHGKTTHSTVAGTEYVFRLDEGTFSVGGTVRATLTEIRENTKDSEIPADGFVICLDPACTHAKAYSALAVGESVTLSVTAAEGWEDVTFALGGGDVLVTDGIAHTSDEDYPDTDHAKIANPRTAVGYTDDGRMLFFAVDGRTASSRGMTLPELAETMAGLGCIGALNLDGGGSTTVLVRGGSGRMELVNVPTDGGERKISNAVLFADTAVSDGVPYFAVLTPDDPLIFGGAPIDFDCVLYDRSFSPVTVENTQVTWSAVGGTVDGNGVFVPDGTGQQPMSVTAEVRITVTASDDTTVSETDEITKESTEESTEETEAAAEQILILTASEEIRRTDMLDVLKTDVKQLVLAGGEISAPIHVWGEWLGHRVFLDPSGISASFVGGAAQIVQTADGLSVRNPHPVITDPLGGFPTGTLRMSLETPKGTRMTSVPVTLGAADQIVFHMETGNAAKLFDTDDAGMISRRSGAGTGGSIAVSFTAAAVTPVTTPTAAHPVRRVDLWLSADSIPADLCAHIVHGETTYILPWTVSDDAVRINGWRRLSLDLTAIDADGIRGFTFARLLSSETAFSGVMDDVTYHFGDRVSSFTDTVGTWAFDAIETLYRLGVVRGIAGEDGSYRFAPQNDLSRAEFAVMIARFMGCALDESPADLPFADAASLPSWAIPYIDAVYRAGYMSGRGGTDADGVPTVSFAADAKMTRAEVLQVLGNLLGEPAEPDTDALPLFADDGDIPAWARTNINRMRVRGLINGFSDNTIRPAVLITRAEVAALLQRMNDVLCNDHDNMDNRNEAE